MKILVIEDNPHITDFIEIALKMGFPDSKILTTHLGNSGIELVAKEKPDIVLLDLELPDTDGFEVLKQIRAFSEVPIIIETVRDKETDTVKGLTMGADDYIGKPFGQLELMARIKTVLKRSSVGNSDSLYYGKLCLDKYHRILSQESNSERVTPTETLIMEALMKNGEKIRTFDDLSEIIWGTDYPGSCETLKVYIRRLRAKVESVSGNKITIHHQHGVGFMLGPI
jgi:two-component system KDP operon response regulator KdpE